MHVIVVDPGVGTDRALLYVETGGQRLLVPDNGCWTEFARTVSTAPKVRQLTDRRFWRGLVSTTFHGRDILAPVAGHLSKGADPEQIGPLVTTWVEYRLPCASISAEAVEGEVLFVDDFGNLITNVSGEVYWSYQSDIKDVHVNGNLVAVRQVRSYGEATACELVMLLSSGGTLEIAEVNGNAARRLGATAGANVSLTLRPPR